jgi:hypothetical protein
MKDRMKVVGKEKVIFGNGTSRDGKVPKLIGRTYDGTIIFPDKAEKIQIVPDKEYMVNVFKYGKVAFARDIEEI